MRLFLAVVVGITLASCKGDIPIAAYTEIVDHIAKESPTFCVASNERDLPASVMRSIREKHPSVYPASSCERLKEMFFQTPDGHEVSLVHIGGWRALSPWHARVEIYYETNFWFGSSSSTLKLRRTKGKWIVVGERLNSIS